MVVRAANNVFFTEQDLEIFLDHLPRYGITTTAVLARLFFDSTQATKKWLGRMRRGGVIQSAPLGLRTKYHRLTEKGARILHIARPERFAKLLGPGARQRAFGVLAFCCLGPKLYRKFTYEEFLENLPPLDLNGPVDCYYRDDDGPAEVGKRIGYILVDCGRDPQRIIQRMHELITQRLNHEAWRSVLLSQRFVITVVTTADAKGKQLEDAIRERQDERYLHRQVPIRVQVREPLREILSEQELSADESETAPQHPHGRCQDDDGAA